MDLQLIDKPAKNVNFAWEVGKVACWWYWWDWTGEPHGPYNSEEEAYGALSDFENDHCRPN